MKLTTVTHVSVDGVMQGLGGSSEDRRGGFERGGWALPLFVGDAEAALGEVCARADAFLFGRQTVQGSGRLIRWLLAHDLVDEITLLTCPVVVGQGTRLFPDDGPDTALELVDCRAFSNGITLQAFRPAGRPRYAPATPLAAG